MRKSARLRAEELFTAPQKKTNPVLKEKERARQQIADKTARLRTLRLAKEAANKEAAAGAEAEKNGRQELRAIASAPGSPTLIVTAGPVDKNAQLITETLSPLALAGKLRSPRGGYALTRSRGRVIVTRAES